MMDKQHTPHAHTPHDAASADTLQKFMVENAPVRGEFVEISSITLRLSKRCSAKCCRPPRCSRRI
jgi:hypothetical protein